MADYWKSQPRKFCEFCKCWIADNKPSVEFHERGKRHKENVQKKIDELRKRSGEKAKEQDEMNEYLAQMERDALEALKKDLTNDPSLAAQYGVKLKSSADGSEKEKKKKKRKSGDSESDSASSAKVREWYEAKSPEGYSYYWNITTNESVWEPPEEYVSLAEQEALEQTSEDTQQTSESAEADQAESQEEEEEEAPVEEPPKKIFRVDPVGTRGAAYGAWETIRQEPAADPDPEPEPEPEPPADPPALEDIPLPGENPLPTDIPLPADIPLPDPHPDSAPQPAPEPVKKDRFKEKTVGSLGPFSGASVGFMKRKVASSARNARQRENDD